MADISKGERAALEVIAQSDDPVRLRNFVDNARRLKSGPVEAAAFRRLCEVQPEAEPGTLEHDVWQSVHAQEEMLLNERGKAVRLTRTRQKIKKDGEAKTASDLTLKTEPSDGFRQLIDHGRPEFSFEAVVLRHPDTFDVPTRDAADARLRGVDVDPTQFHPEGA